MQIKFNNLDFQNELKLPQNIIEINENIFSICNNLPALNITSDTELLNEIISITKDFMKGKETFVVFGTGGSNLGARALINVSIKENSNLLFYDNIDPNSFQRSFSNIDFNSTAFIVISKSGKTPETLFQFGSIAELASQNNELENFYKNTLIITEFGNSPLFNIAKKYNCLLLEHKKDIGGRYSVFSNVGMVPAIIAGLNVQNIYEGANKVKNALENEQYYKIGQLFKYQNNLNLLSSVLMTYSDSLYYFGKWYLQLWAESIGKKNQGITPIHSIGATDQHSQLQLYLDGPKDKFFTFITTNHSKKGLHVNNDIMISAEVNYLVNRKMGDLMQAEQQSTLDVFNSKNIKFREIFIEIIDEKRIGELMAASIVETVASCIYFGVDPFNQPAVEAGKKLTKQYLS